MASLVTVHCFPYFLASTPETILPQEIAFLRVDSLSPHSSLVSAKDMRPSNGVYSITPFSQSSLQDRSKSSFQTMP